MRYSLENFLGILFFFIQNFAVFLKIFEKKWVFFVPKKSGFLYESFIKILEKKMTKKIQKFTLFLTLFLKKINFPINTAYFYSKKT